MYNIEETVFSLKDHAENKWAERQTKQAGFTLSNFRNIKCWISTSGKVSLIIFGSGLPLCKDYLWSI